MIETREYSILPQSNRLVQAGLLVATGFIATTAFTKKSRKAMIQRDGGCTEEGDHVGYLEASHDHHSRANVDGVPYNDIRRGKILCSLHHLIQHLGLIGRAREAGLSEKGNDWAIDRLQERVDSFDEYEP